MLARMRRNIIIEESFEFVVAPSSGSGAEDKLGHGGQRQRQEEGESERTRQKEIEGQIKAEIENSTGMECH